MQGLITLLFLVGMFISWYSQQKKKEEERLKIAKSREELRKKREKKKEEIKARKLKEDLEEYTDLKEHHIKSNIKFSEIGEERKLKPLEKIDRLSYFKKAIIWKEIFDERV